MYTVILLSGGTGSRMRNDIPKQYALLAGKPVIMHTLERINRIKAIAKIVIVCSAKYVPMLGDMLAHYNIMKPVAFAEAGTTRQASVMSGLEHVATENVIIHEAARPFVAEKDFLRLIKEPSKNAIYGTAIPFTVVKGHGAVESLLERSDLVNVQLPQKFGTELLKKAHAEAMREGRLFTEDAGLVHYYSPDTEIKICEGMDYNIKLTVPVDMLMGEVIYKEYFMGRK